MQALTGPALVGAALLIAAGVPKLRRPAATTSALRSVGLVPVTRTHVRVAAAFEIALGGVALTVGGVAVDAVAAAVYLAFSLFLVRALRGGATVSCGCSGREDTPPTVSHLVLTGTLAVLLLAAAFTGGHTGLTEVAWSEQTGTSIAVVGLAAIGTWLGWVVMTALPRLQSVRTTVRTTT